MSDPILGTFHDTETASDERPNIQIDDLVRPMTDEEYAEWLARPTPEPLA